MFLQFYDLCSKLIFVEHFSAKRFLGGEGKGKGGGGSNLIISRH